MNLLVERLKRLPQSAGEIWQGGLVRLPGWVKEEGCNPYRPWISGWVSTRTKLVHMSEPAKDKDLERVLVSLVDFACNPELAGYRPTGVDVRDGRVADYLRERLAEAGITVEQRKTLYTWDRILEKLLEESDSESPLFPRALDAKGVTVEAMRGFAEAACEFYRAEPWRHLKAEDLIEIESPFVDATLRYASLLDHRSIGYGLGFYGFREQFDEIVGDAELDTTVTWDKCWVLFFGSIVDLPLGDADLWQDHDLAVAKPEAYPLLMCCHRSGMCTRPGPDVLAFVEGLLRAIARTTEEQMDAGRWEQEVATCEGGMTFKLALPDLLEAEDADSPRRIHRRSHLPDMRSMERTLNEISRLFEAHGFGDADFDNDDDMEDVIAFLQAQLADGQVPRHAPRTPLDEAQEIIYDAFEAVGRRQLHLIRKALAVCPDCADAHVLLAERSHDIEEAMAHYERGMAAAERALGPEIFEEDAGYFWGIARTRPYMRARLGLATCLDGMGRLPEAVEHYRELLRLNPNDNQGVRELLLPALIKLGAEKEALKLWKRYEDDVMAVWCYLRALLTFRKKGDTATARKHLGKAIEANPHVPSLLLGEESISGVVNEYTPGSYEEAVCCAGILMDVWEMTDGALEWLDANR